MLFWCVSMIWGQQPAVFMVHAGSALQVTRDKSSRGYVWCCRFTSSQAHERQTLANILAVFWLRCMYFYCFMLACLFTSLSQLYFKHIVSEIEPFLPPMLTSLHHSCQHASHNSTLSPLVSQCNRPILYLACNSFDLLIPLLLTLDWVF